MPRDDPSDLREIVEHLASFDRPSASDGERRGAEWIAGRLRAHGHEAEVEPERAHGTYWWPLGIFSAVAGLAGLLRSRLFGIVAGTAAALGVWDELGLWWRRSRFFLPKRTTWNVVGRAGDPEAEHVVAVIAHHDAAHGGAIFDQALPRWFARTFPDLLARSRHWPQILWLVFLGPVLVALGSLLGARRVRRIGSAISFGSAAAFADISRHPVVPGANDNLSGVAAMLGAARSLAEQPVEGIRVLLVSNGSEESFEEGMAGFVRTHEHELPRDKTWFVVLDTVGSPQLVLVEGEGMLVMEAYDAELKDVLEAAGRDAGADLLRGHWLSYGSDALIGLRTGYRSALLASFDEAKLPSNYHSLDDLPEHVDYERVADAAAVVDAAVRRLAQAASAERASASASARV
jgi:hypothetical protein